VNQLTQTLDLINMQPKSPGSSSQAFHRGSLI
jgi:hypothetical protein